MEKFEYQIIQCHQKYLSNGKAQEQLNQLGLQGWELISHSSTVLAGTSGDISFLLKRKI